MNQVQILKSRFENLNSDINSLDLSSLRQKSSPPIKTFSRSATCIDFSKFRLEDIAKDPVKEEQVKPQFQRQSSNSSSSSYKSIRRSPAFRFDAQTRPSVIKSIVAPVKRVEMDELEYLSTSATIKKALMKPLPTGSPPKKPPRTFLSPQYPKKNETEPVAERFKKLKISPNTLPKKTTKTDEKKPLGSFLNCIISPCSIDPIYYEHIKNEQALKQRADESIYMEPFAHLKNDFAINNNNSSNKSPRAQEELHYMCTVLDPQTMDSNGNSTKDENASFEASDIEDYEKVKLSSG